MRYIYIFIYIYKNIIFIEFLVLKLSRCCVFPLPALILLFFNVLINLLWRRLHLWTKCLCFSIWTWPKISSACRTPQVHLSIPLPRFYCVKLLFSIFSFLNTESLWADSVHILLIVSLCRDSVHILSIVNLCRDSVHILLAVKLSWTCSSNFIV